jgi:hypothetical protein
MNPGKATGFKYGHDPESGLAQTTEWNYYEELDGGKFRTRFERESEFGEHRFVVQECDRKTGEWMPIWVSSWIGKKVQS